MYIKYELCEKLGKSRSKHAEKIQEQPMAKQHERQFIEPGHVQRYPIF